MAISPSTFTAAGDEVVTFTNGSGTTWTTDIGGLYTDLACTTPYAGSSLATVYLKPFNRTTSGSVVSGGGTATGSVIGVIPSYPNYPLEWKGHKIGIVSAVTRTGRTKGRMLGDSQYMRNYKLVYDGRKQAEVIELEDFQNYHMPDKVFIYRNKWHNIDSYFIIDSELVGNATGRQRGRVEIAIAEVPYP